MKEILVLVGICFFIVLCIVVGALVPSYLISERSCYASTSEIGLDAKWDFWAGCRVEEDGKWIPLENWRYFGE